MRAIIALACAGLGCLLVSLLLRDRIAALSADRTPLSVQLDAVLSRWARENVALEDRALRIALSDEGGFADPFAVPPPPRGPGWVDRMADRVFGPLTGSRHRSVPAFPLVMGDIPDLIDWSYRGRPKGGAAAEEFGRILVKASAAGARITVLTHGYAAAVALRAISEQKSVRVERLVSTGIGLEHLREYEPDFSSFQAPPNLGEWVDARKPAEQAPVHAPSKADGMSFIKVPSQAKAEAPKTDRIALGDSGWSVKPPAGFKQLWANRPGPGRIGTLMWTRGPHVKVWLSFGKRGLEPEVTDACARIFAKPERAEVRGFSVEACSNGNVTEDQGLRFGAEYFTLFDGDFLMQVRHDHPTGKRQDSLPAFEAVCDSLSK